MYQAYLLRFRTITMTTMAALLAGLPLMLGTGTDSDLRRPLGFAMVGELVVPQTLTLFTTPVIYIHPDQLSHWLQNRNTPRVGDADHLAGPSRAIGPQPSA